MYTLYLLPIGEVSLYFSTVRISGYHIYISGRDQQHNQVDLVLDKLCYPDILPGNCGYCHILSYTVNGNTTKCNLYRALH